ncbi:MAG: phosphoribosylaminoimidazolesuccinocarboxamide synthase [Candidatus Zixiibacteriota bacterium]|nr:MAG: phosphoribosylaminoimidazolesuccinocarboxamide synthase [candidate division Zixibacteria bacterium]
MTEALLKSDISEYPLMREGKVRDVYDLGDSLLFVTTDRISAFDWLLPNGIPGKGIILNKMSLFWFFMMRDIIPDHLLTGDFKSFPEELKKYEYLDGRSMIVKKAQRIDIECVARWYLVGSGYRDYRKAVELSPGEPVIDLYGYELPSDFKLAEKLPFPIFTPATKEDDGHDINISYNRMAEKVGDDLASRLRDITLAIYSKASEYAFLRGIIIADTKFEFGYINDELTLIDEILSPDSSRFWPVESYSVGSNPPSFDKQFIRDFLETTGWDKNSPPPELPPDIVQKTMEKYKQAHKILTGSDALEG